MKPDQENVKPKKKLQVHPFPEQMGISDETYESYLKEHNKRLRRLAREASGRNMTEPE